MEGFLPNYDDPIVSILLLLGIVFLVSVAIYTYSIYSQERRQKELLKFIEHFDSKECSLDTKSMPYDSSIKKPLFLLALAFIKSGDYPKSINIYLYLLKHTKDDSILKYLANAYFKAGFLQRALDIYLEILSKHPRDKESLFYLEFIYEKLGKLDKAYEVAEVLEAQNTDIEGLVNYLDMLSALRDFKSDRFDKLSKILNNKYRYTVLREMFKIDAKRSFAYYKESDFAYLIDILYRLNEANIDYKVVDKSYNLSALYKGEGRSDIFGLNLYNSAKLTGFDEALLEFSYVCTKCKSKFPLSFNRCSNCHRLHKMRIEVQVAKQKRGYNIL